jgi:competence ComEA-like helix-hairpin-helix protein
MQEIGQNYKPFISRICRLSIKLIPSIIFCCLFVCCGQKDAKQSLPLETQIISESAININTASAEELEKLPHVGAKTAREIVAYRAEFGKFRKPEHLMLVSGISDARFREIRKLIKTE